MFSDYSKGTKKCTYHTGYNDFVERQGALVKAELLKCKW